MALEVKLDTLRSTRRTLLNRLKDWNDRDSWERFYDRYSPLVYSVALKAGLTQSEAEEAVQETFIAVAKKMQDFNYDPAIGSFKSWLIHTTRWRIADQLRRRKNQPAPRNSTVGERRTSTIERVPDPASLDLEKMCEEEWQQSLFAMAVEKIKGQVTAKQFQIFDLYVLKKWPVGKVTTTLGVSRTVVYLAKHRVAQLVKKEIKGLESQSF